MVMLQLAQLGAAQGVMAAMNWILSDAFVLDYDEFVRKFQKGSDQFGQARRVAGFYETVGTVWKHRLINEDLLFDWLWVEGVWNRLKGFALGLRKEAGNPLLFENFEAMSGANRKWQQKRASASGRRRGEAR
jgi:hypothetical protein